MLNGLDLFSGIGGIASALAPWVRPVAYCENDRYCQAVLFSRMEMEQLVIGPIWDDVRTLSHQALEGTSIDIITAGFPCQDISVAGHGKGLEGERSGLFFEICRLIDELRPPFLFLENVPAITTRGGLRVVGEITQRGYDSRWLVISAAAIGAPHKRERWFLLAYAKSERLARLAGSGIKKTQPGFADSSWWEVEPAVGRVADGVPFRVDRIKCLGNAVVPFQARKAFERLMGLKDVV